MNFIQKYNRNEIEQMKIYANLHTHSTHSDGPYSPRKLAEVAKAEGYGEIKAVWIFKDGEIQKN